MLAALTPAVTWIQVEKPQLDLVGVVLGALGLAGALALAATVLGIVLGGALILRHRRHPPQQLSLQLDAPTVH